MKKCSVCGKKIHKELLFNGLIEYYKCTSCQFFFIKDNDDLEFATEQMTYEEFIKWINMSNFE